MTRRDALRRVAGLAWLGGLAGPGRAAAQDPPGRPAPPAVRQDLRQALTQGVQRFEARDLAGVLALVSEAYRTGPLTKPTLHAQLVALFSLYAQLRAPVRIDDVRLVGEHAWVYTTGEVSGLLPMVNQWVTVLAWERELEVARREDGAWRLFGYQQ
jgi:hypothetical protein